MYIFACGYLVKLFTVRQMCSVGFLLLYKCIYLSAQLLFVGFVLVSNELCCQSDSYGGTELCELFTLPT